MNWALIQNSLLVAGITTAFSTLLGFFSALWLAGLEARWRKFIAAFAILSLALPAFLVTNCWLDLLGLTGTWRSWLPLNIFSLGGAIWILTLMNWPISLFFVLASWRRLEQSQMEIDPLLTGSSLIKLLLFPTAKTAIVQAALLTFVIALNNFSVPAILQVKVFPAEVWVNFNTTFDYKSALQLCWPMVVAPLLLLFVFRERNPFWTAKRNEISAKHFRQQLGTGGFIGGGVCCVFAIFFSVLLPVSKLLLAKATWSNFLPAFEAGKMAMSHSALFAAVTAFVIVSVALLSWRWPLDSFSWLTFLVPGVLLGIFLIWIFNRGPFVAFYQSIGIVIFAFALRYFAPGWNIVAHSLRTTDRILGDAAQLEGANGWQLFRHVQLPQIFPQLCVAWYVTYLFCLWDVETLIIIVPPGSETVALRVFNLLHYGHNSQVNALCVSLLALAILPMVIWKCLPRRLNFLSLSALCFLFAGCSDSNEQGAATIFPIRSKFFSSVQIVGSRGTGVGQFNKPRSLALDRDDNLFVVDMTGRVQKFSPDGRFLLSWQMPQTDLGKPKGMGRDSDRNVIVVEPHYMRVNHFTPDGKLVFQWGIKGTNEGQLMFPRSVAINSHGELFFSEYGLVERVQHFSKDGKTLLGVIGKPGEGSGEFNRAEGIGIDAKDRLYVADSCNHRIQIFSPDGKFLRSYGKAGNGSGELSYPYDVRVDANGFQFVCEFGNSRIQIFDANDQPVEILGEVGTAPGQFANPWSIDFDSHGNLYVADALNHRVQKFIRSKPLVARVAPASGGCEWEIAQLAKNGSAEFQIFALNSHPQDACATR